MRDCFVKLHRKNGIGGFWQGLAPNVVCSSIINACLVATYDQTKEIALANGFKDGTALHFACAVIASTAGAIAGNPTDVIKSRTII